MPFLLFGQSKRANNNNYDDDDDDDDDDESFRIRLWSRLYIPCSNVVVSLNYDLHGWAGLHWTIVNEINKTINNEIIEQEYCLYN